MPGMFDDIEAAAPSQAAKPAGMFDDIPIAGQEASPSVSAAPKQPFTLMDTWPVKLGRAIFNAAKLPGDVYQGNADVPQSANMPGGETSANIGRVSDLASIMSPLSRAGAPTVATPPTPAMLKEAAGSGYEAAKNIGVELRPEAMDTFGIGVRSKLDEQGLDSINVPKTHAVLSKLSQYPDGSTVTANNLRTIQKSLGNVKNMSTDPAERMASGQALGEFNNLLENLHQVPSALAKGTPEDAAQFSSLVKEANGNYAAYKQGEGFDFRGNKAEYATNAAHSGMNLENNLRSQVRQILSNPKNLRGLDNDTVQALKDFNTGSRTANTMRLIGNLFGGGGGIGMLAAGSVGHLLGLPFELAPAVGVGLKSMANTRAANEFGKIGDLMRANSPLAQSGVISRVPASPLIGRGAALGMPMLGINPPTLAQPAY